MADTIIDGTEFNAQNTRYSQPKVNSQGGKSVNILNSQTKSGLRLSTPVMLTWGASDFVDEKTGKGNGRFEMGLQFPGEEYKNADTEAFLNNMVEFEQKIKDDALTYSKEWFGKQHKSADIIEELFTPMLKYSKNKLTGEYDKTKSPSLRVKIPFWEGVWKCEVYDEDENLLFPNASNPCVTPLDFLQKGATIACVIQCGGLWFANGKFGITWKLIQAVGAKQRQSLTGKCLIKLKSSDKEKIRTAPVPDEDAEDVTLVEDSDGEEEEVVAAPVPAPAPSPAPASLEADKPKKKVVKKKVVGAEA
jgi:hypothetical protein